MVNAPGQYLQVYAPTANGGFNTTSLTICSFRPATARRRPPRPRTMVFNLPANATPPTDAPFSPTDPNSYNQSTSLTVYDSLGAAHTASMYFVQYRRQAPGTRTNTSTARRSTPRR